MRPRRTKMAATVGTYMAEWWPTVYANGKYTHVPPKEEHRRYLVKQVTEILPHPDPWYRARGYVQNVTKIVTPTELIEADLTNKNSTPTVRHEQAAELKEAGYGGPLGSGEARALKGLFTELGKPDLIKHGWAVVESEFWVKPTARALRRHQLYGGTQPAPQPYKRMGQKLQNCYVFKSPLEGVHFSKFIRLARMYRDDSKKLRTAVEALLANPDAAKEIEALDAMELLAGMQGM